MRSQTFIEYKGLDTSLASWNNEKSRSYQKKYELLRIDCRLLCHEVSDVARLRIIIKLKKKKANKINGMKLSSFQY